VSTGWFSRGRRFDVACTVEVEHTAENLHAHVELDGVEIEPGDSVTVHDAPTQVAFGEKIVCRRMATVERAGLLQRAWTRFASHFELTELYEVSFSHRRRP
jgi:hypothetical protein